MDLDKKHFTTSALAAATGCEPMTFRTWRNRNGLFPEAAGGRTWKRFSVLDLCVVRAIVVLTGQGVGATDAIWFVENHLQDALASLIQGIEIERYVALAQGDEFKSKGEVLYVDDAGNESFIDGCSLTPARIQFQILDKQKSISDAVKDSNGIITIVDLLIIVEHVLQRIKSITSTNISGGRA